MRNGFISGNLQWCFPYKFFENCEDEQFSIIFIKAPKNCQKMFVHIGISLGSIHQTFETCNGFFQIISIGVFSQ